MIESDIAGRKAPQPYTCAKHGHLGIQPSYFCSQCADEAMAMLAHVHRLALSGHMGKQARKRAMFNRADYARPSS